MSTTNNVNVRVAVRVRPFNARELRLGEANDCPVSMVGNQTILSDTRNISKTSRNKEKIFTFDHSFWSTDKSDAHYADQKDVYQSIGLPVLENSFKGCESSPI
eukprot:UC4_evm2s1546